MTPGDGVEGSFFDPRGLKPRDHFVEKTDKWRDFPALFGFFYK